MLKDQDRIFTNIYGMHDRTLAGARKRGHWDGTATIIGKLFGTRYLGTLFGIAMLSHQIGGFLGAWLGGLAVVEFGDFRWMWYADIVLALLAAVLNLPIREAAIERRVATA